MEIVCNFHSGYFDCRGSFQTVFDLYYCITVEHNWQQNVFFLDINEAQRATVLI